MPKKDNPLSFFGKSPFAYTDPELDSKLDSNDSPNPNEVAQSPTIPTSIELQSDIDDTLETIQLSEANLPKVNDKNELANSVCWALRKKIGELYLKLGKLYEASKDNNKAVTAYFNAFSIYNNINAEQKLNFDKKRTQDKKTYRNYQNLYLKPLFLELLTS